MKATLFFLRCDCGGDLLLQSTDRDVVHLIPVFINYVCLQCDEPWRLTLDEKAVMLGPVNAYDDQGDSYSPWLTRMLASITASFKASRQ